ncbi:MAG: dephospho-CoA kinase [Clostridia bacterium]|nr:dephospho-CoA kinase [Clostridia bacterium]
MRIGLTGGIAAGKSLVSGMLVSLGAWILDADAISREVVEPGTEGLKAVAAEFGGGIINSDGTLNRRALAEEVFGDAEKLERLNDILHPLIKAEMLRRAELIEETHPEDIVVFDVPLLIESGWQDVAEEVWLVSAPIEERIRRIALRDGLSEEQAMERINAQMTDEQKAKYADVIIDNGGSIQELEKKVTKLYAERKYGKKEEKTQE